MQVGFSLAAARGLLFLFVASGVGRLDGEHLQADWQQTITQAESEYTAGRLESSRDLYVQALGKAGSESQRAFTLNRLGLAHVDLGNYREAFPYYNRAKEIYARLGSAADGSRADVVSNLSVLYYYTKQYRKAETLCREALALRVQHFGPSHREVGFSWQNLGGIQRTTGQARSALESFRYALAILNEIQPPYPAAVAKVRANMALLYLELKQSSLALEEATTALETARRFWGDSHPVLGRMQMVRGIVLLALNRFGEAGNEFSDAIGICEHALGANHPRVGEILWHYAQLMRKTGRKQEAKQMGVRAAAIMEVNRKTSLLGHVVDVNALRQTATGRR
jgi:tetratricopeptide (TPR) repeat protein